MKIAVFHWDCINELCSAIDSIVATEMFPTTTTQHLAVSITWFVFTNRLLHRTSFTLVNLQTSSSFETRKLYTLQYHITATPHYYHQNICSCTC